MAQREAHIVPFGTVILLSCANTRIENRSDTLIAARNLVVPYMHVVRAPMRLDARDTRSDLQLLKLSRNGDRDAFGQLVRKHYRSCVNVATSILRDRTEAEDEVQQALWKAFEHLDQYLGEAEFFTWLARIVANECRMLLRSKKRARFVYLSSGREPNEDRHPELLSAAADPEYQALNCEMINVLRDVEELTMTEVAQELGITVSAAKSRLLRARIELRKRVTLRFRPARHVVPLLSKRTLPARHVQRSGFAA
jgi:RNA polymerase sigma-70 factor, ECF subfamily